MKNIIKLILLMVVLYGSYRFITNHIADSKWTLMICSSLMSDGVSCQDNSLIVPGYDSYASCFAAGYNYGDKGFECGRGCRQDIPGGLQICHEICNAGGCN